MIGCQASGRPSTMLGATLSEVEGPRASGLGSYFKWSHSAATSPSMYWVWPAWNTTACVARSMRTLPDWAKIVPSWGRVTLKTLPDTWMMPLT